MSKELDLSPFSEAVAKHPDSISGAISNETPSTLSDFLVSAGQGATFGFGDELLAALQTAGKTISGKTDLENMYNTYRQLQQQHQEEYNKLKERSPTASLIGELAGGFAIPGGLIGKLGGSAAGAVGAELSAAGGAGELAAGAAKAATPIMDLIKGGTKIGAIAGAGSSEKNIEDIPGLAKDIATGGAGGAILGTAGGVLGKGLQGAQEYIAESPAFQRGLTAFELEKSGVNLTTKSGQDYIVKKAQDIARNASDTLIQVPKAAMSELNRTLTQAEGLPIAGKELTNLQNAIESNSYIKNNYPSTFAAIKKGEIDAPKLFDLKKQLIQELGSGDIKGELYNNVKNLVNNEIESGIKSNIPNIDDLRESIKLTAKPIENYINNTVDLAAHETRMSDMTKQALKSAATNAIYDQMGTIGGTGIQAAEQRVALSEQLPDFKKMIEQLSNKSIPLTEEAIQKLQPYIENPDAWKNLLAKPSQELAALKATIGNRPSQDSESIGHILGSFGPSGLTEQGLVQVGGKFGRIAGKPYIKPIGQAADIALNRGPQEIADILKSTNTPGLKQLGDTMDTALQSKSRAAVGAAINTIMQSPSARSAVRDVVGVKE